LRDVPWDTPIEAGESSPGSIYRKRLMLPGRFVIAFVARPTHRPLLKQVVSKETTQ
jgi:hypothetical protein